MRGTTARTTCMMAGMSAGVARRRCIFSLYRQSGLRDEGWGWGLGWGAGERSFACANDAHLSDDEAVAKMGHPVVATARKQQVLRLRCAPLRMTLFCGADLSHAALG